MKNAIIIHGRPSEEVYYSDRYPSSSNFAWIPWLQKQLLIRDIKADTPEMPHSYEPDYEIWKREFERFDITPETALVGHSAGGGFIVRYLSENKNVKVAKVILVAPSLESNKTPPRDFYNFEIDPEISRRAKEFVVFVSDNDSEKIKRSVKKLESLSEDIRIERFQEYGHFTPDHMHTNKFPELLKEVIK